MHWSITPHRFLHSLKLTNNYTGLKNKVTLPIISSYFYINTLLDNTFRLSWINLGKPSLSGLNKEKKSYIPINLCCTSSDRISQNSVSEFHLNSGSSSLHDVIYQKQHRPQMKKEKIYTYLYGHTRAQRRFATAFCEYTILSYALRDTCLIW